MNSHEAILLLVISIGAFIIPFISKRLSLPSAVGEILFGLIIGIYFRENFHEGSMEIVKFLGELGFIILMYLAGLEIDFEKIKITPKRDLFLYLLLLSIIVSLSFWIIQYLNQPPIYALIYLTVGVGLLFSVLKDTNLLKTNLGQSLLIIASIGEVISLMFITFFSVYYKYGLTKEMFIHILEIYLFFSIVIVAIKIVKTITWWYPNIAKILLKTGDPSEIGLRANFMNMFVFVAMASIVQLEPIIGAFMGGMLVALIFKDREHIEKKLSSLGYGFLIPIFFIEVGLSFDIFQFLNMEIIESALMLTLIIFLIRFAASVILLFTNLSKLSLIFVPLGLSIPLTLLVAIAKIGLEAHIITEKDASVIVLTAILTGLIYPWLFKMIAKSFMKMRKNYEEGE
jgi:Kef-type K+ transport system membrane component KefB